MSSWVHHVSDILHQQVCRAGFLHNSEQQTTALAKSLFSLKCDLSRWDASILLLLGQELHSLPALPSLPSSNEAYSPVAFLLFLQMLPRVALPSGEVVSAAFGKSFYHAQFQDFCASALFTQACCLFEPYRCFPPLLFTLGTAQPKRE